MKSPYHNLLSSFSYHKHKKYKYVLCDDFKIRLNRKWRFKFKLIANGKVRAVINEDILIIYSGYAWDGCTGVPDFPGTLIASLLHDLMFQFGSLNLWTFEEANEIFYHQMIQDKFKLAKVYYAGVISFGRLFYAKSIVYKESLSTDERSKI